MKPSEKAIVEFHRYSIMLVGGVAHIVPDCEGQWYKVLDVDPLLAEKDKFKSYVHKRLDDAGIPTNPDGPHTKEGCRIGDRLDILIGQLEQKDKEIERLRVREREADDQLAWIAQWCRKLTGIENNTIIGRDGWPHRLVEVVAKAVEQRISELEQEIKVSKTKGVTNE